MIEPGDTVRFHDGDEILTLYVEKVYRDEPTIDQTVIGWCPERENTFCVFTANLVEGSKTKRSRPPLGSAC